MAESYQMPIRKSPEICHSWLHVFVVRGQFKHLTLKRFHKDFASLVPYMIKWNEILNARFFFTGLGRISPIVPFCFFLCYTLWSSYSTVACSEDRVRKSACKVQIHDLALFYAWLRGRKEKCCAWLFFIKNIIRGWGSIALYTVYTVYTIYTVCTNYTV